MRFVEGSNVPLTTSVHAPICLTYAVLELSVAILRRELLGSWIPMMSPSLKQTFRGRLYTLELDTFAARIVRRTLVFSW